MVEFRGVHPYVRIEVKTYAKLKTLFSIRKDIISVFATIEKQQSSYTVKNFIIPKQSACTGKNIIKEKELEMLGKDDLLCIIRGGRGSFDEKTEDDFLGSSFSGIDNFVGITMPFLGCTRASVYDGDIVFKNVFVDIFVKEDKEAKDKCFKLLDKTVTNWIFSDGASPTTRVGYIPSALVDKNVGWREVVK